MLNSLANLHGIELRQLIQSLSQNFELSLNGRSQQLIALVSGEVLARDKPFDPLQSLWHTQRFCRGGNAPKQPVLGIVS
jgi:hypothetical protein